ncbi:hypothetical protein R1flu_028886 [Riccia fluitans]|uniref:Uncharacterized protein n=1 Tax=Riccia fluitans TaxID=41844 RepID=A0ABD1XMY0_9MARC
MPQYDGEIELEVRDVFHRVEDGGELLLMQQKQLLEDGVCRERGLGDERSLSDGIEVGPKSGPPQPEKRLNSHTSAERVRDTPVAIMDSSLSELSSSVQTPHHDSGYDGEVNSENSSGSQVSLLRKCCQSTMSLFWKRRPVKILLLANALVFAAVLCSEILMFETSTPAIRRHRYRTAIFPLHLPSAVAFAANCKLEGSVASANFLGFLAGRLYIAAYGPRYITAFRPKKLLECTILVACTVTVLCSVIFSVQLTTFMRPLPYLFYPLAVFSALRFNRFGWAVVLAFTAYFCSLGALHYRSSAFYLILGKPHLYSSRLILQIEAYMAVLGVVTISLAAAFKEKAQLTKDLHDMNQRLEDAVRKRTQELLKANSELEVSQGKAEKASHAKSDFLASMSHEIRTPIHGILGLTDLLFQSELSADQLESMMSVKDCADLLLHIINNILDLAKLEAGRLQVENVPFKIRDVVSTSLRMLEDRAKASGIMLLLKVDSRVPSLVAGDPGKLQQCLLNLVGNALKFTHQGSVIVSIRALPSPSEPAVPLTTPVPSKRLSANSRLQSWASWPSSDTKVCVDDKTGDVVESLLMTRMDDAYPSSKETSEKAIVLGTDSVPDEGERSDAEKRILFEVRDTGIGINKEIVLEMFNPFTQADASTSRLYGGTGLGLCIVQRFVELLRGKIWVESEIGEGSTFRFVVPFQTLMQDETEKPCRRLRQPYYDSLNATFRQTSAKIEKRAAASHSSQERRLYLGRSLDSSGFADCIANEQAEMSADSVDSRKRTVEAREESYPGTIKTKSRVTEKHRKLSKGAANLTVGDSFIRFTNESSAGEHFPTSSVSSSNSSVEFTSGLDSTKQLPIFKEGKKSVRGGERSSFEGESHHSPASEGANWDLEQGLVAVKQTKPDFVELVIESPVDTAKVESAPKIDREQSTEISKVLPREENLRILLAEDNLVNQKVASRQLTRHGHTVTIVSDGLQALETLRKDHDLFDLVLMDIQMPNMDGLRATSIFREEEASHGWRKLPILGLTAHAMSGYQDICSSHVVEKLGGLLVPIRTWRWLSPNRFPFM